VKELYAVYVLISSWSWDHSNQEMATITIEGVEGERVGIEFEKVILEGTDEDKCSLVDTLRGIAEKQNGSLQDRGRLVALCRVIDRSGCQMGSIPLNQDVVKGKEQYLFMTMKPICTFDEKDNIIPTAAISA